MRENGRSTSDGDKFKSLEAQLGYRSIELCAVILGRARRASCREPIGRHAPLFRSVDVLPASTIPSSVALVSRWVPGNAPSGAPEEDRLCFSAGGCLTSGLTPRWGDCGGQNVWQNSTEVVVAWLAALDPRLQAPDVEFTYVASLS